MLTVGGLFTLFDSNTKLSKMAVPGVVEFSFVHFPACSWICTAVTGRGGAAGE